MKIIKNKYISASSKRPVKAYHDVYIELASKSVYDSDGFTTDYTLYSTSDGDYYFCMFGDKDVYEADPDYADFETWSEDEAWEWFNSYEGFTDEDDYSIYGAVEEEPYDDENAVRPQQYTSKDTAINWKYGRVPAIFKKIPWVNGTLNLDYGGGTPESAAIADGFFVKQGLDVTNLVYDKFNQTAEHNREVLNAVRANGGADTATLSNVLNVIKEPEVRLDILNHIKSLLKPNGKLYIYGYEGGTKDKGKGGRETASDQYQTFMPTKDYLAEIHEVFPNATIKSNMITAINDGSNQVTAASVSDLVIL